MQPEYGIMVMVVVKMLPVELHKYFWEFDAGKLDKSKNWFQIIERILEANRWVYRSYPAGHIGEVIRKSRQLSKRTVLLWQNLLEIPKEEIICLRTPSQRNAMPFLSN